MENKLSLHDFIKVTREEFFKIFDGSLYDWHRGTPNDISWWEAHASFVTENGTGNTVGYMVTSSYGAPDEFYILKTLK